MQDVHHHRLRSKLPTAIASAALRPAFCGVFSLSVFLGGCATVATNSPAPRDVGREGGSTVVAAGEKSLGFGRTYRLHVPDGVEPEGDLRPLVVALHGGLATARIFEKQTGFSDLADEYGFLVVYPNGNGMLGLFRHWNAGWCCAKAMRSQIDDVGYIDRVIDQVAAEWPVDPDRIYLVGYSNGGMLAHHYARQRSDRLAGLAVFAGPEGPATDARESEMEATSRLPVMIVHGTSDPRLPFDGGEDRRGLRPLGALETASLWATRNGCDDDPIEGSSSDDGAGIDVFEICANSDAPVRVLLLEGWGHEWPGPRTTARRPSDRPLAGFDAARAIWQFWSSL